MTSCLHMTPTCHLEPRRSLDDYFMMSRKVEEIVCSIRKNNNLSTLNATFRKMHVLLLLMSLIGDIKLQEVKADPSTTETLPTTTISSSLTPDGTLPTSSMKTSSLSLSESSLSMSLSSSASNASSTSSIITTSLPSSTTPSRTSSAISTSPTSTPSPSGSKAPSTPSIITTAFISVLATLSTSSKSSQILSISFKSPANSLNFMATSLSVPKSSQSSKLSTSSAFPRSTTSSLSPTPSLSPTSPKHVTTAMTTSNSVNSTLQTKEPSSHGSNSTMILSDISEAESTSVESTLRPIKPSFTTYIIATTTLSVAPSWTNWKTEKNCQKKCCGLGGTITQLRACVQGKNTLTSDHSSCLGSSTKVVKCEVGCPECSSGSVPQMESIAFVVCSLLAWMMT